ncbi:MAG TPA: hypothetical protein VNM22_09575 [Candidatus Limnocylindrales bacterium]|nr:hypothetical protein [Candidatus Limnocylindrales bacterium]
MRTGITRFLVKATGPSRLRSELCLKTKPLGTFLKAMDAICVLQTQVPRDVLEGGVLTLMSGRLRQLLQYPEQSEKVMETATLDRWRFASQDNSSVDLEREKLSLSPVLAKKSSDPLDLWKAPFQSRKSVFPASRLNPKQTWKEQRDVVFRRRNRQGQPVTSLLVKKLGEYRQLNQGVRIPEGDLNQSTRVEKDQGGNGILSPTLWRNALESASRPEILKPSEEGGRRNQTSFSTLSGRTLASRSWPEMTGQQIAQRLHAFVSGQGGSDSSQRIQKITPINSSEKVEIQNIFNIDVEASEGKEMGSLRDLSEKIVHILREQALQHGIDIT